MKLLSLSLKGFGPYTDVNVIDFPQSRKVAILGTNGAGKTFLLDSVPAALFKAVPNRKGGFYEQFSGNDAFIDLTFLLNGDTIKVRRLINAVSRTQKAFIWKNGEALNDGKDAAFSDEIKKLGINETAFMAAIYQTQNGVGNALNMDVDARIKLLSIILDLLRFDVDHLKVVDAHKAVSREIDGLKIRVQELGSQLPNVPDLVSQEAEARIEADECDKSLAQIEVEIEKAIQSVANAKANAQGVDDLKRDVQNLTAEIENDDKERADLEERIQNNKTLIIDRKSEIEAAVQQIEINRAKMEGHQAEIQQFQAYAEQAQGSLEQWNKDQRAETTRLTEQLREPRLILVKLEGDLRDANMAKAKIQTAKSTAEGKINSLRPSTEIIDRVPCQGMEINQSCELLKNAHANIQEIERLAKEIGVHEGGLKASDVTIGEIETRIEDQKSEIAALEDDLKEVMAEQPPPEFAAALQDFNKRISDANALIKLLNGGIALAEPLAKLAPNLEGAEEKVADYQTRVGVLTQKIATNRAALEAKQAKIREASDIEATIQAAERTKAELQGQRLFHENRKKTALEKIGSIRAELNKAETIGRQVQALDAEIQEQQAALAEIQILREGLGPKGAKNVKIDAAGKAITERANRLIRIGLGPQFSILINTLKELTTKDENGDPEVRETLELKIINNDNGEEMLIENLSGGEKAMAGLVFSLSLAVEQREASGLDIRTLILDEPSAGLSEENSIKYLNMLDAVLDETGIEQVFFISHMPSMQNLADASILVRKGSESESSKVEVMS